jgi:nucleolar protein 9
MPRENRKRGKKHKKQPEQGKEQQYEEEPVESLSKPSWIIAGPKEAEEVNPEAPYGYVDADIKAYFRTIDVQIRDWQENRNEDTGEAGESGDTDPNDRTMMLPSNLLLLF